MPEHSESPAIPLAMVISIPTFVSTIIVVTPDVIRFILQCLQEDALEPNQKQHHTVKRIYNRLVIEMGFKGSESNIRKTVRTLRGCSQDVYVPLSFAVGDAMQIDWDEAYAYIDGVRTKLNVFCARLGYSCAPFAVCFHKQNTESFLEGLILAFEFFGGVARRVLFDNAKVAVKGGLVARLSHRNHMQHWQLITVSSPSSAIHAVATRKDLWKTSSVGLEEIYLF